LQSFLEKFDFPIVALCRENGKISWLRFNASTLFEQMFMSADG